MVVRGHRIAVDKNHGYAGLGEAQCGAVFFHDWADDEPVDALDERLHETLFLLGALIAVGQDHLVAQLRASASIPRTRWAKKGFMMSGTTTPIEQCRSVFREQATVLGE